MTSTRTRIDPRVLFWAKVGPRHDPTACWLWLRAVDERTRGRHAGTSHRRYAWSTVHGPVPTDHTIIAMCNNLLCCNPAHLSCVPRARAGPPTPRNKPLPLGMYRLQVQVSSTLHEYVADQCDRQGVNHSQLLRKVLERFLATHKSLVTGPLRTPWGSRTGPRHLMAVIPITLHHQLLERFPSMSMPLVVEAALTIDRTRQCNV